jgi:hypothetical protein
MVRTLALFSLVVIVAACARAEPEPAPVVTPEPTYSGKL